MPLLIRDHAPSGSPLARAGDSGLGRSKPRTGSPLSSSAVVRRGKDAGATRAAYTGARGGGGNRGGRGYRFLRGLNGSRCRDKP